jgi:hypothetical protein
MANLNGHGAGNGGHSQGEPTDTAPVLDPTERAGAGDGCFAYRASPRPYPESRPLRRGVSSSVNLSRKFFGSVPSGCESDLVATPRPANEFTTVQMCTVRGGFCQSQIDEPIKLAAIPIHMNHVLKICDFANGGISGDEWNGHRIIELANLPQIINRAQPIGHGLGIGFRPAGTNHFLVGIFPASDQPYSIHAGSLPRWLHLIRARSIRIFDRARGVRALGTHGPG